MNSRRSFFKRLAIIGAAFTVLPSALTYKRVWKPLASGVVVPDIGVPISFDANTLAGTIRQLFNEQKPAAWYMWSEDIVAGLKQHGISIECRDPKQRVVFSHTKTKWA